MDWILLGVLGVASFTSAKGAFASRQKLISMSALIGTKDPVTARVVCIIGLVVFTAAYAGAVANVTLNIYRTQLGWVGFTMFCALAFIWIVYLSYSSYRESKKKQ
jgi:hypothetical protein